MRTGANRHVRQEGAMPILRSTKTQKGTINGIRKEKMQIATSADHYYTYLQMFRCEYNRKAVRQVKTKQQNKLNKNRQRNS